MSILIKGMKMPKEGCKDCPLVKRGHVFDICPFIKSKREVNGNVERGGKPHDCPLVELSDHGDLIDRDALKEPMESVCIGIMAGTDSYNAPLKTIDDAPVIIPAERNEDGET